VAELPGHEGETVTVAGLIVQAAVEAASSAVPPTATLDDGTGRVRLGGDAAADAISLLEAGDAIEATGLVSRDAAGLLIEVDPEKILSVSGAGEGSATGPMVDGEAESPSPMAASGRTDDAGPAANGQAHGLARPAGAPADFGSMVALTLAVGFVPLALFGLAVTVRATSKSGRRPWRTGRRRAAEAAQKARDAAAE
jgi:hypothetical protein